MQIPGYTLIKKINSGGMATVYLATQHSVGRTLALKVMRPALDTDPGFHQRFQREATIIGQLSHPNIIPIYDIGRHQSFNYISMEFLPQGSLEQKIAEGIPLNETIKIMMGIASALEHAHTKGFVHRDIKPENILFRDDGSAVLTDFGVARTIESRVNMTQVGMIIGTPLYMSPEQAKGEASDGRSDLYSLGVVFYEMLTGSRPFHADSPLALGIKHIHEPAPSLPLKFLSLQPALDKLLAKNPDERYQNARDLITFLDQQTLGGSLLFTAVDGKVPSLQLLKTATTLLAKDVLFSLRSVCFQLGRLERRILGGAEKTLLVGGSAADFSEARTIISNSGQAAVGIVNAYNRKRIFLYSALSFILVVLIGISLSPFKTTLTKNEAGKLSAVNNEHVLLGLMVNTTPAGARVRILNIKESYRPGINLAPGTYHIEASLEGFVTENRWVNLKADEQQVSISLTKRETNPNTLPLPEMVLINAGEFLMGNPGAMRKNSVKKVSLTHNFYIGRYEVTFNEYDYFAVATNRALPEDNGWGRGNQPVVNVSWDDAISYTNWLSKTAGQRYRLATAAEWEYAARGDTTSNYWWGNNENDAVNRANCRFGCKPLFSGLFKNQTQPVGSYPPNDFGLYDTAGNVAEWVDDCGETTQADVDPVCKHRLTRGGSYADRVADISAFSAAEIRPDYTHESVGFRVVRIEEKPPFKNIFKKIFSRR